jgi:hypothetical protein
MLGAAGLAVSSVGFVLTLLGVGFAIYQSRAARQAVAQSNQLLGQLTQLEDRQTMTGRTVGEISVISAYLVREFSQEVPDPRLVARQYEALVARAERLVGGRAALEEMVGELR